MTKRFKVHLPSLPVRELFARNVTHEDFAPLSLNRSADKGVQCLQLMKWLTLDLTEN